MIAYPPTFKARPRRATYAVAVTFLGEEVKRCSIMPDIVSLQRLPCCGVRDNPMNLGSVVPKACFRRLKCSPDRSRTVTSSKPRLTRLSTRREAPPPMSMIAEAAVAPTCAINSSEGAGFS